MFIYYVISSIKIYKFTKILNEFEIYGFAVFLGIISYFIVSIFNDSIVGLAPIFWILFGLGTSINRTLKIQIKN